MTEHDITVAREMGELKADMRTVKHDVAGLSGKMDGLAQHVTAQVAALTAEIAKVNTQQARGLGFFAGAAFIITAAGGILLTAAKLIFGGQG